MSIIFESKLLKIGHLQVIRIPLDSSKKLPSRGMVMVRGTINNLNFKAPLEPDGKGSHWIEVSTLLSEEAGMSIDKTVFLNIEPINEWIEPEVSEDIMNEIINSNVLNQWNSINAKSRWEWVRWIRSTLNLDTRNKRINVMCSKLQNGDKKPCCFDTTRCTVTDVSKSGVLL
ncbi:YdeI/OmpD-associated family protein [Clostridium lacusfryxellense]|uniref:YdeI/OmpD-associated family protein n=1 Tax=Clostridium lacusfryxellense TaxID=205328 RepID=UPI001C0E7DB7|nr:YdeI/OmpD-associated family protein [Clostridium lacusfryxellense]MBU3113404.1 YdeI/OmpD-associated family protein [Clostridium lacusfryxellense]